MPDDAEYNFDGSRKKDSPPPKKGDGKKVLDAEKVAGKAKKKKP